MKKLSRILNLILGLALMFGMSTSAAEVDFGAGAAEQDEDYTLEEMMQYAIEDERMAQAEYEAIMEEFDITRPFTNILRAEYTHEAALLELYDLYGYKIPEFEGHSHTEIPDTLEEIYTIGIEAEIANIKMYESFLQEDLDEEVAVVFEALRDGSIKHLAAFERGLDNDGSATRSGNQRADNQSNGRQGNSNNGRQGNSNNGRRGRR